MSDAQVPMTREGSKAPRFRPGGTVRPGSHELSLVTDGEAFEEGWYERGV